MREKEFRDYYRERNFSEEDTESAIRAVQECEWHLKTRGVSLESMVVDDIKEYVSLLISQGKNSRDRLVQGPRSQPANDLGCV